MKRIQLDPDPEGRNEMDSTGSGSATLLLPILHLLVDFMVYFCIFFSPAVQSPFVPFCL